MTAIETLLHERLSAAFATVTGTATNPAVRASAHADFQADGALAVARSLGLPPRTVAARVLAAADLTGLASAEVSGPGFVNLTVDDALLTRLLAEQATDPRLGVARTAAPQRVVVDYSGPNAAKEMHVGHLRSTIIGDAAVRLLEWLGHTVIRRNHIGEWGTPFGMLIEHLLDSGAADVRDFAVRDLTAFYQAARLDFDGDPAFAERSRARVVALQSGDPESLRLWRLLVDVSKEYFDSVYRQLDVLLTPADYAGESTYHDQLDEILAELSAKGLVQASDGAAVVYPPGSVGRDGQPLPLIVRKRDGGFGYPATDLAALRHRLLDLHADRVVYVVGLPQQQHFEMVFGVAAAAGWLPDPAAAQFVGHGSVLGPDGKLLRTRAGSSAKLGELLDAAITRADAVIAAKNPELDDAERAELAQVVGVGAVKYADLSVDRTRDYVFDLDRMLSLDGDTALYLQYAYVRTRSIATKAGAPPAPGTALVLQDKAERVLALRLLAFDAVIGELAGSLRFHKLTQYLRGLAEAFTTFFERCPVLRAQPELRDSRLVLCELTGRTLSTGLGLLGIQTPQRL
jgi:arginyl-tRNA synthetase